MRALRPLLVALIVLVAPPLASAETVTLDAAGTNATTFVLEDARFGPCNDGRAVSVRAMFIPPIQIEHADDRPLDGRLVFVGDDAYAEACRSKALAAVEKLADLFDLHCRVETEALPARAAGDGTDCPVDASRAAILMPATGANEAANAIACGTVNRDGTLFGRAFSMSAGAGRPASTGSVELPLESWVLAAFCQHGFDPERWPAPVGDRIFR